MKICFDLFFPTAGSSYLTLFSDINFYCSYFFLLSWTKKLAQGGIKGLCSSRYGKNTETYSLHPLLIYYHQGHKIPVLFCLQDFCSILILRFFWADKLFWDEIFLLPQLYCWFFWFRGIFVLLPYNFEIFFLSDKVTKLIEFPLWLRVKLPTANVK